MYLLLSLTKRPDSGKSVRYWRAKAKRERARVTVLRVQRAIQFKRATDLWRRRCRRRRTMNTLRFFRPAESVSAIDGPCRYLPYAWTACCCCSSLRSLIFGTDRKRESASTLSGRRHRRVPNVPLPVATPFYCLRTLFFIISRLVQCGYSGSGW